MARRQKTSLKSAFELAFEFQRLLDERVVDNHAEIAERYGISRARVTQLMNLPKLPRETLSLLAEFNDAIWNERQLRGIVALSSQEDQIAAARTIVTKPVETAIWPTLAPWVGRGALRNVSQRCRLPDGEATWIHSIQAFEIAPLLVIRF